MEYEGLFENTESAQLRICMDALAGTKKTMVISLIPAHRWSLCSPCVPRGFDASVMKEGQEQRKETIASRSARNNISDFIALFGLSNQTGPVCTNTNRKSHVHAT